MAEVVRQRERLRKIIIEPKPSGERPCDLSHLERMGQPRPEMVAFRWHEDLRLVSKTAKGRGMDDPVAVALKR